MMHYHKEKENINLLSFMGSEQRDDGHYAYFEYAHDETLESLDIKGLDDRTRQSLVCQIKNIGE